MKLELSPEIEAGLLAQARAAGLSLHEYLRRELQTLAQGTIGAPQPGETQIAADEWERELDEWLDSFPQTAALREPAFQREDWYPDRW